LSHRNKIAFFGTSHTYGDCAEGITKNKKKLFKYLETPWPELFAKKLNKEFYNFGIGGSDNMTILDAILEAFSRGIMDDVETVILEPRLSFDTVKVPFCNIGYTKRPEGLEDREDYSSHWLDHARHTKIDDPTMPMPKTESLWTRFALMDLNDPDAFSRRIDGVYNEPEYNKTMEDRDIQKYVQLDKLYVSGSKYLQYLNLQFIKNVYQLCKGHGIKFYWLNWESFLWERFTPFFEQDNHLMELNITPFKCVMTYMDKDVPGDIKDFQCSCGHFNQKAQHYITQFLTQGYNERTNN